MDGIDIQNYFGYKTGSYNSMLIPVGSFPFSGTSTRLQLTTYVYRPTSDFTTFRWAICSSDSNKAMYQGVTDEISGDSTQLASGTASLTVTGWSTCTFDFETTSLPANSALYVYFWPAGKTGVAHVKDTITASLYYTT